ncbi:MAG: hypothetical protein V7K46_30765 [Nostoc sp.]
MTFRWGAWEPRMKWQKRFPSWLQMTAATLHRIVCRWRCGINLNGCVGVARHRDRFISLEPDFAAFGHTPRDCFRSPY